jgi:phytoene dehydrogenase-like protein
MSYDVVIVGAGIAGLRCGIALAKQKKKVCLLEKYGYVGGRVVTYKKHGHQWENGAGRISDAHSKVLALISKYDLHTVKLATNQLFIPKNGTEADAQPNTFEDQFGAILSVLVLWTQSSMHTILWSWSKEISSRFT